MPRQIKERKILAPKPGKEEMLVKMGRKGNPENVTDAVAGMQRGEKRSGSLGDDTAKLPDRTPEMENLDVDGKARKGAIKSLLINTIQPTSLGFKSTPDMDRRAFVNKANRMTLAELRRFMPERVDSLTTEQLKDIASGESDIFEEEKAEIQTIYMDLSP